MKFTDGSYRMRSGVKVLSPKRVFEYTISDGSLLLRTIDRVDQREFQARVISLRFSSPAPGIIRVQAWHLEGKGDNEIKFPLDYTRQCSEVKIDEQEEVLTLESGPARVRIIKLPFRIEFEYKGKRVTSSQEDCLCFMSVNHRPYMVEYLGLGIGEYIYGLGERFGPFVKNGQSIEMWNDDGATNSELAYKNVPFYLSNRGYGVFVNSPGRVEFEVGTERVENVQFSVPGNKLDYYIFLAESPMKALEKYVQFSGLPALPPAWSFGLWLTTSFQTEYDEAIITDHIEGMMERDIPLRVFHFDCFWMKERHWCDFKWDRKAFPNPTEMLTRMKEKGLKICLWINPYISEMSSLFAEGKEGGYFLKNEAGEVYQADFFQPAIAFVDFTNPKAVAWYQEKLRALLDMGVDTFKTDFGESAPVDAIYYNKADPIAMRNYYSYLYNQTVFDLLREYFGEGKALVFARSATACCQRYPVHWGGDTTTTFDSMAEELRGGLSLAASGFAFWSHDIGGFRGQPDATLYKRWIQFGLLSSHSRLHGCTSYRVPWLFDEEAVEILRSYTYLKQRLMPYLYRLAVEASEIGRPLLRPMMLEFPHDPTCAVLDRQYMLGECVLVAPVFNEDGEVEYYLPEGKWTNLMTGEIIFGGVWRCECVEIWRLPIFVRENSILPLNHNHDGPDYDYLDGLTLEIFELKDGVTICCPVHVEGRTSAAIFKCTRNADMIQLTADNMNRPWRALLRGLHSFNRSEGKADVHTSEEGIVIVARPGKQNITIGL